MFERTGQKTEIVRPAYPSYVERRSKWQVGGDGGAGRGQGGRMKARPRGEEGTRTNCWSR